MKNELYKVQALIDELQKEEKLLRVLEAGCGSISKLHFAENVHLTGIDISQKQLDRNTLIHEKILGDIQSYEFSESTFDVIVCWHVLEHLPEPKSALNNFFKSIKKNGLIVIASPNPRSLKGLVTKFTPHWFHVFVYRYIYGRKDAGRDDQAPFKTFIRFNIAPERISEYAKSFNVQTEIIGTDDAFNHWVGQSFKEKSKLLYYFIEFLRQTLKVISFGYIGDSEFLIVLRKI